MHLHTWVSNSLTTVPGQQEEILWGSRKEWQGEELRWKNEASQKKLNTLLQENAFVFKDKYLFMAENF